MLSNNEIKWLFEGTLRAGVVVEDVVPFPYDMLITTPLLDQHRDRIQFYVIRNEKKGNYNVVCEDVLECFDGIYPDWVLPIVNAAGVEFKGKLLHCSGVGGEEDRSLSVAIWELALAVAQISWGMAAVDSTIDRRS